MTDVGPISPVSGPQETQIGLDPPVESPEVTPDFRSEASLERASGNGEEATRLLGDSRKRALAWLRRDPIAGWRPRKRQRVASWEVLAAMENALQVHGGRSLQDYDIQEDRIPVHNWPCVSVARDNGPDVACAMGFLLRGLRLNCDDTPDPSHAAHRDVQLALRHTKLWPHELLMLTCWNCPFGAWDEDTRYHQAVDCLKEKFDDPEYCYANDPIFQALLPQILMDRGLTAATADPEVEADIWRSMQDDSPWNAKRSRVHMNRFLAAIKVGTVGLVWGSDVGQAAGVQCVSRYRALVTLTELVGHCVCWVDVLVAGASPSHHRRLPWQVIPKLSATVAFCISADRAHPATTPASQLHP